MQDTYLAHALPFVLSAEGGYTDNPNDAGGATCMGIEQREYDAHRIACGLPTQSVRYITTAEASNIYHNNYWSPIQGDSLPFPIDWITFDAAVNIGVVTAGHLLEEALRLPEQYAISQSVVDAALAACANVTGTHNLKMSELSERLTLYHQIVADHPNDAEFLHGWLNRVQALQDAS